MASKEIWRVLKPLAVIGLTLVVARLYWHGAVEQLGRVNVDMTQTDQFAYMNYARNLRESNYTFIGGRNRMPVYPFLQSLFHRADMTDEAFFEQGKYVNLVLSLLLLAGLAFIFYRYISLLATVNLILIFAFTIFIFKAGYFQTELLFYFVSFCLFLLMCKLLQRVSWWLAILTGIVAGLGHLTKASILPGLAIFLVLAVVKWGWVALRSRRSLERPTSTKAALSPLLGILLVAVFFLITVFPYISTSKRVFGHYFYNVNSTFYMWYDSWDEAKEGTRAHGDRVGWPDMPPEEIPSMSKYLREHTAEQIVGRFTRGAVTVLGNTLHSYGYFKYILIYLCLLLIAVSWSWQRAKQAVFSKPILFLFLALYFTTYFLLYAWYTPIAPGNRLPLAMFIPLMFSISLGIHALLRSAQIGAGGTSVGALLVNNLAILVVVLIDIYFVLTERVGSMYGGL
jgi:4-amino-4-deoxy-L-arabinose transferase-like glycosyltransferase